MTDTDFATALKLILQEEGGRVDDPHDPGGRTNEGVTQRVYDAWRRLHKQSLQSVYVIEPWEVQSIYLNSFGLPIGYAQLPPGVGYAVLDYAVNSGVVPAVKKLQSILGLSQDGVVGAFTFDAAARSPRVFLINRICDSRLTFLHRLQGWGRFGHGWTARVEFVREHAKAMANVVEPEPQAAAGVAGHSGTAGGASTAGGKNG